MVYSKNNQRRKNMGEKGVALTDPKIINRLLKRFHNVSLGGMDRINIEENCLGTWNVVGWLEADSILGTVLAEEVQWGKPQLFNPDLGEFNAINYINYRQIEILELQPMAIAPSSEPPWEGQEWDIRKQLLGGAVIAMGEGRGLIHNIYLVKNNSTILEYDKLLFQLWNILEGLVKDHNVFEVFTPGMPLNKDTSWADIVDHNNFLKSNGYKAYPQDRCYFTKSL
jgi:hypothetical protein